MWNGFIINYSSFNLIHLANAMIYKFIQIIPFFLWADSNKASTPQGVSYFENQLLTFLKVIQTCLLNLMFTLRFFDRIFGGRVSEPLYYAVVAFQSPEVVF